MGVGRGSSAAPSARHLPTQLFTPTTGTLEKQAPALWHLSVLKTVSTEPPANGAGLPSPRSCLARLTPQTLES